MKVYEFKNESGKTVILHGKREMDNFYIERFFVLNEFSVDEVEVDVTVTDTKTGKIEHKTLWDALREA